MAAGLFSKAVWDFEINAWNHIIGGDASEVGSGPGSYDIRKSVWHVNCCNPELNGGGGWGIFNALLGWTNSATVGSVLAYNLYWILVIISFVLMRYFEHRSSDGNPPKYLARFRSGYRRNQTDPEMTGAPTLEAGDGDSQEEGVFQENKRVEARAVPTNES